MQKEPSIWIYTVCIGIYFGLAGWNGLGESMHFQGRQLYQSYFGSILKRGLP